VDPADRVSSGVRAVAIALSLLGLGCPASPTDEASGDGPAKSEPKHEPAAPTLPAVNAEAASQVREALEEVDVQMRGPLAAQALAELERGRLPDSLCDGLESLAQAPPDQRAMLVSKAISENLPVLHHLCGDESIKMMKSLAQVEPEQRGEIIYQTCELGTHGYVQRTQIGDVDAISMLLAHMVHDHLQRNGELHAGERAAIAALATTRKAPSEEELGTGLAGPD